MLDAVRRCLSETFGTFALVFFGAGAVMVNEVFPGKVGVPGIALAFGLVLFFAVWIFANVSGAHFNPAVSFASWLAGRLPGKMVLPYILSQLVGAVAASLILKMIFPDSVLLGTTEPSGSGLQSFFLEVFLTFALMLAILNIPDISRWKSLMSGLVVGVVVGLEAFFAGPISGASMNPARSAAPALVSGHFQFLWIYIVGPTAGAALAILFYIRVRGKPCCTDPSCIRDDNPRIHGAP